jgi:hypothetical protein
VSSACAWSVALVGLEGRIVEVEADIGAGLPRTVLVGLPDSALYQARDRCKAAVSNSEQEWPISLLTINLSPATLPKAGSHYDLAIVAAILAAQGIFQADELHRTVLLGELGLDGRVRPVRGVLPATLAAQQAGFTRIIVPMRQAGEAKLVAGIDVFGIASITQLVAFLRDEPMPWSTRSRCWATQPASTPSAVSTWQMWSVRPRRSGPAKSPLPAGTTCSSMARQASARPCSPSVSRGYFPISTYATPSKYPLCTHWLASTLPTS